MTETERAAWAAFEAGIVEDAMAAGLIDAEGQPTPLLLAAWACGPMEVTTNGDGTWDHTFTAKGERE